MTSANFPHITAATAIVLAVLQVLLALYTANGRGRYKTGLGDGGHPQLLQRMRAHGNLAENAPLFLILLWLAETTGEWTHAVPIFAAAFIVFRLSHAIGLLISAGLTPFRFIGVIGTVGSILGLCGLLARTLSHDTHWIPFLPQ